MFYNQQSEEQKKQYKDMLKIIGNLSMLFSENNSPYLSYRAHENIFCKFFDAENLARVDCSADAQKNSVGIGLKTWVGNDNQKIAEFNRQRSTYENLSGIDLVKKISEYRNNRINITKNMYGIENLIYHIIKRVPNKMQIIECSFDNIDIENITILNRGGNNNIYFTDNKHTYNFNTSKSTLYMIFENYDLLEEFEVEIQDDPYNYLTELSAPNVDNQLTSDTLADNNSGSAPLSDSFSNKLCLRLYSYSHSKGKFVAPKSGLNQWNAAGRTRNPNELYIPYPAEDRAQSVGFFPDRDTHFTLLLPDRTEITAKVCQDDGKAIMSAPNKDLGEWLLRKVLRVPEGTLITYDMLENFGIDSVIFTKIDFLKYKIDFCEVGTYEEYIDSHSHVE